MSRYIDADALLNRLPDDLPYKESVKRVLMQAEPVDLQKEIDRLQRLCDLRRRDLEDTCDVVFKIEDENKRLKRQIRELKKG